MLAEIKVVAPELLIEQYEGYTLLSEAQLPFDLGNLPETYSKFRRQVESVAINLPMNAVTTMPRQSTTGSGLVSESLACDGSDFEGGQFKGGEAAANEHLVTYLNSDLPLTYKQTRNEIDGWENSSKLSPWLNSEVFQCEEWSNALTSLKPRRVATSRPIGCLLNFSGENIFSG